MVSKEGEFEEFFSLGPDVIVNILENVTVGLMFIDNDDKILFINKQFEELVGYNAAEILHLSHHQAVALLVGEHTYAEIKDNLDKVLQGDEIARKRSFIHKKGYKVPLEVSSVPIYDNKSRICGTVLMLRDLHQDLMIEITQYVNSTLSLNEVLNNTVKATVDNLGLSSTAIFLLTEEKNEVQLICCNVFTPDADLSKARFKIGQGPPGRIIQQTEPVYVRNLRTEPGIDESLRKFHGDKSSIGYRLVCKNELLGAIAFDADTVRDFSEKEKMMFQNIANQVALAIYNARLFSRLEHLSATDGLTGLYNHRHFQKILGDEISRARPETNFGVLMLDADHFKSYNDRYGHLMGDQLLRELAKIINNNVRSCDVVARYGGEEFVVILPNCTKEEGLSIAERIRHAVEHYDFSGIVPEIQEKITVSVGLAMYPDEPNRYKLLLNADAALYRAKQLGRNRVVVHFEKEGSIESDANGFQDKGIM